MQLFSRNKALAALSLGALAALGACGDDVTVPVAPAAPVVISITPPSASMNVGEALNFAVQISGGSTTAAPTLSSCTSSNAAVATAAVQGSACRVTAVAAGNATVTAAASTGQVAAASVTVSAPTPAITSLAVSPSAAQLGVGQSVTLVPTVQPAGRTVTYTYATSSAATATVSAAGVVTAVAPGVATITVTAAGSGAGFANASIQQAVTITVSERTPGLTALNVQPATVALALGGTQALTASVQGPRASAATITYGTSAPSIATVSAMGVITAVGQGTAVVTVTAQSTQDGAFAASSVTALVPVTVSPNAQVVITSLTDNGSTIDITNVVGQFEVNLSVQPNGQNVSSVQAWVCDPAETVAQCAARTNGVPAAQQSFTAAGAQASNVQLYINSAEFNTPNFTTGEDANTLYKNGLRTIVATLTTTPSSASTIASNNISQVNFNNPDGWTIQWMQPTNRANDASGITWYGGPSTPDPLVPGATSGDGSFTVVPVIYTPNRTIASATVGFTDGSGNFACGSNIQATQRPFRAAYGTNARSTTQGSLFFNCGTRPTLAVLGAVSDAAGYTPTVVSSIDNNNAAGPTNAGITPAAATSIYTPINAAGNPAFAGRFRQSLAFRPNTIFIPGDYRSPVVTNYDVRGGGGTGTFVDSAWVNGTYSMAGGFSSSSGNPLRLTVTDGGVGLLGSGATTSARNTQFQVCAFPATISTTAATTCTSPIATGGITATVASMNIPEAADLTNRAYFTQVVETDRLGNRGLSVPATWSNSSTGEAQTQTAGINTTSTFPSSFGVDLTAPTVVAIPNTGTGAIAGFTRTDVDSIYATTASGLNTAGAIAAEAAVFAVRFTDSRAGFPTCTTTSTNCFGNNSANVRGGNFQITRRTAPALANVSNDALVESLVNGPLSADRTFRNSIDAGVFSLDNSIREFSIGLGSVAGRNNLTTGLPANIGSAVDGYYTFTGTLIDRAGNSTTLTQRTVAVDNSSPAISSLTAPAVLTGGSTVTFTPTASDPLEVISADLQLTYGQLGRVDGNAAVTLPTGLRFWRVPNFASGGNPLLGFWHNPFQSLTDNKLAYVIGAGTTLGGGLNLPISFIQQLITVDASDAPISPAGYAAFTDVKPSAASARVYDIRTTSTRAFTDLGRSAAAATVSIGGGQVPTSTKDWTTSTGGSGITSWQLFSSTGGVAEFRATTSTSVTNPPFTAVHVIRAGTTEWEYLGTATFAGTVDQGALRFYRYTFTFAGTNQGQFTQAGLTGGDIIRAVGVDASGNGLSTRNGQFGLANAIPAGTTIDALTAAIPNGGTNAVALSLTPNPAGVSIAYTCSTSSPFLTAAMTGPATCTLTAQGTAAATVNADVVFTATGVAAGTNTNTITRTVTFTRVP
ncbi:MAG: Ig-like domain-containing protein [Gemmatimonas sp.]|jgi:uncharacterized protein YjdB|uniref:beta strand repeat-containing protein n=1 Tax=Gemmatimonas sp. TaxID=1962908 RepID=UPI0025C6EC2B|nr:Ig-like domain-containing protein [Gemmatimonas sp.]MCE2954984.1 Ig-like domain-containing protein [Gemmatimonas sp.]